MVIVADPATLKRMHRCAMGDASAQRTAVSCSRSCVVTLEEAYFLQHVLRCLQVLCQPRDVHEGASIGKDCKPCDLQPLQNPATADASESAGGAALLFQKQSAPPFVLPAQAGNCRYTSATHSSKLRAARRRPPCLNM